MYIFAEEVLGKVINFTYSAPRRKAAAMPLTQANSCLGDGSQQLLDQDYFGRTRTLSQEEIMRLSRIGKGFLP